MTRRLLLVHAHPDDETINHGVTMASAVAAGVGVTLITCTRGELGEVVAEDLAHLRGDPVALGAHREGELAAAMTVLGVVDHRFLGADVGVRYRDSGMVTLPGGLAATPTDLHPDAFAGAELDTAAQHVARVIREVRPHVVLTYESGGGYGHPDHVMAHRVTMRAVELAAEAGAGGDSGPAWQVAKIYGAVIPRSLVEAFLTDTTPLANGLSIDGPLPSMIVDDERVAAVLDRPTALDRKVEALAIHRSQVVVDPVARTATAADGFTQPILGVEWGLLLAGDRHPPFDDQGRELDIFAGTRQPGIGDSG